MKTLLFSSTCNIALGAQAGPEPLTNRALILLIQISSFIRSGMGVFCFEHFALVGAYFVQGGSQPARQGFSYSTQ